MQTSINPLCSRNFTECDELVFSIDMMDYELLELPNSCETLNIWRKGLVPQKPPNSQIMVILCYCLIVENGEAIHKIFHYI